MRQNPNTDEWLGLKYDVSKNVLMFAQTGKSVARSCVDARLRLADPGPPPARRARPLGTPWKSERLKGLDPDARGPVPVMPPTRRSPKKLRLVKSSRTARASKAAPRKPAASEGKKKRPALRTYDAATARQAASAKRAWEQGEVAKSTARAPDRRTEFTTDSGIPLPTVLTAADRAREDARDLGLPGEFPFTRGVQPTMYRGRLWTMRMFAGFGSPEDTNQRFKYLMAHGTTGLSTAFDMPALMGYDADHPMSRGEVGKEGVAISTLRDFEILFDGIPLDQVTTSMTINASAIVALCMYIAVAEKQGIPMAKLGRHHPERHAEGVHRPEGVDRSTPAGGAHRRRHDRVLQPKHMPRWHPVSISGYHIREAGATAVQELAFTLADGIGYVEECVKRGMEVDDFAPRLSFFWDVHNDFFEEIAKFRAARRIWARVMRERFGARDRAQLAAADARPDRRRLPHRPAAVQQRGAHRAAGAGRGARRHPVAAHQLARRDLRPPHRGVGHPRPAHPAAHRPRVRRGPGGGPARRQLLRRVPHRRDGEAGARVHPPHRRDGRHHPGGRGGLSAEGDRRERLPLPARGGAGRAPHRRASTPSRARSTSRCRSSRSTSGWPRSRSPGSAR